MPAIRKDVSLLESIEAEAKARMRATGVVPTVEGIMEQALEPYVPRHLREAEPEPEPMPDHDERMRIVYEMLGLASRPEVTSIRFVEADDSGMDEHDDAGLPATGMAEDDVGAAGFGLGAEPAMLMEQDDSSHDDADETVEDEELQKAEPAKQDIAEAAPPKVARPDQVFDLGARVAKCFSPWTEIGSVDQIKAGAARVRLHEDVAWHANHKLTEALDPASAPAFKIGDFIAERDEPWQSIGKASHFSADGATTYVDVLDENGTSIEIVPAATSSLVLCDAASSHDAFDPLFDTNQSSSASSNGAGAV